MHQTKSKDYEEYIQDRVLRERKQREERSCPHHGTCDHQRDYRTVQLQADHPKSTLGCKGNRAKGKSKEAQAVNFALDNIKAQIVKHYQCLSDREACVTAEMVRNAYQGIGTEYETLLRAFDKENAAFAKRVGKDRSKRTYLKYLTVRKYVAEFIRKQYKTCRHNDERTYGGLHPRLLPVPAQRGRACAIFRVDILHTIETYRHHGSLQRKDTKKTRLQCTTLTPTIKERGFLTEEELQALGAIKLKNPNFRAGKGLVPVRMLDGHIVHRHQEPHD